MKLDNPPAFPQQCADALDVGMVHEGMSLRDWFAGRVVSALLARNGVDAPVKEFAEAAYYVADAMLAERARTISSEKDVGI